MRRRSFRLSTRTRECALGASYGGYMADWVLTHTNRFKCIVTHDGMYNPRECVWGYGGALVQRVGVSADGRRCGKAGRMADVGEREGSRRGRGIIYGKPASEDPFRKWSPMQFIKNAQTPTLMVHSQRDYRLDVSAGVAVVYGAAVAGCASQDALFSG